jgi:hypothetical protein
MPRKNKSNSLVQTIAAPPLTAQDRTAQAARLILDETAKKRADLTAALRAARLARAQDEAALAVPAPGEDAPGRAPRTPKTARG